MECACPQHNSHMSLRPCKVGVRGKDGVKKKGPEVNVREGAMGSCRYATVVSLHTAPQFQQYRLVAYPTRQHNALAMHLASKWGERQAIMYGIALEAVCCAPQGQTPT